MSEVADARRTIAQRGKRLEYFTIVWNSLEGSIAVVAGVFARSISLVGFGMDSFIEVTSGATLLWRMSVDADVQSRERNERLSLRIVGICFIALAIYIAYEAESDLAGLLLNVILGWWWADPVAALIMAPIVTKEGLEGLKGKTCCSSSTGQMD